MNQFEILIDRLLAFIPVNLPFISELMHRPEGRYIIFGLAVVTTLLAIWVLIYAFKAIFGLGGTKTEEIEKPPFELLENVDSKTTDDSDKTDGFSFFKKGEDTASDEAPQDKDLIAIEQEMLAVRRLYTEGRIIKEVYVSETRQLYKKAKSLNN